MAISSYASSSSPCYENLERAYFQQLEKYLNDSSTEDGWYTKKANIDDIKKCLKESPENTWYYHKFFLGMTLMSVCPPLPPRELLSRERITCITLSTSQLTAIPEEIYEFTSLTTLDVSKNKIREISSKIGDFKKLERFDLEHNAIEILAEELYELTNMTYLNIGFNKITTLSSKIGELVKLELLFLLGNPLTEIPVILWKLEKLGIIADEDLKKDSRKKFLLEQNL